MCGCGCVCLPKNTPSPREWFRLPSFSMTVASCGRALSDLWAARRGRFGNDEGRPPGMRMHGDCPPLVVLAAHATQPAGLPSMAKGRQVTTAVYPSLSDEADIIRGPADWRAGRARARPPAEGPRTRRCRRGPASPSPHPGRSQRRLPGLSRGRHRVAAPTVRGPAGASGGCGERWRGRRGREPGATSLHLQRGQMMTRITTQISGSNLNQQPVPTKPGANPHSIRSVSRRA